MLIADRKYLFQIIRALDGNRADPFVTTPAQLQENIVANFNSERDSKHYVLVLADTTLELKPQEMVSKFPLFTMESWTNLTFRAEAPQTEPEV